MVLREGAPTSGNIESVASSWASSAVSAPRKPSSQTCNTSGRTWDTKRPEVRQMQEGKLSPEEGTGR